MAGWPDPLFPDDGEPALVPWPLSASSAAGLRGRSNRLMATVDGAADLSIFDVGRSLASAGNPQRHRVVLLSRDRAELVAGGEASRISGVAGDGPGPVFVFPGQGPQWAGMARELLERAPVFAAGITECAHELAPFVDWSLIDVLRGAAGDFWLRRDDIVQPALFAVLVSLARLWQAAGVAPAAVVGHSNGEIAAACVAGALSIADGARVVALWSRAQARLAGQGGMLAVPLPLAAVTPMLAGGLSVAAVNGPRSVVVSGDLDAVDSLLAELVAGGVRAKRLPVDLAAHSPQIQALRAELLRGLAPITPRESAIPFHSTVTGEVYDTRLLGAEYWLHNLGSTVWFERATRNLLALGHDVFVEISPHPVLNIGLQETIEDAGANAVVIASAHRERGAVTEFVTALARAHVRGVAVDWRVLLPEGRTDAVVVPDEPVATVPAPQPVSPLEILCRELAASTGRPAGAIRSDQSLRDFGLDSVAAVELRNRLNQATGLRLPATVVFDHPTVGSLAAQVTAELAAEGESETVPTGDGGRPAGDAVAIVAMACRFPGGVRSPEDLWDLMSAGVDATGPFPTDRGWRLAELTEETVHQRRAGFLPDVAGFDPALFGVSPREALAMDPQQRLLLECSWEALERAGLDPTSVRGTEVGVFAGLIAQEYGPRWLDSGPGGGYAFTGTTPSVASGRIAYVLGLEGPAITVDTACSSSLVAVHLAVRSLLLGECSLALAGGATVMSSPGMFAEFSRQRALSADGRCKAFSADANGFGLAEGVGVLLLERLSDARRLGHDVQAVIRGSAVNSDGASNGMTAPSGAAQRRVIRTALNSAGLRPSDVDAVEAHGTGTVLGDPIEAGALVATYGPDRPAGRPLWLGSVKSNLGHTQAAAGIAGVIKMVLAMRHGVLPKTLHVDRPTPHVDFAADTVALATEPVPWPDSGRVRRAAVSSFGISGTNAHLILEQSAATPVPTAEEWVGPLVFAVSGADAPGMRRQAARLAEWCAANPGVPLRDVAFTLLTGRAALRARGVVVARDRAKLVERLTTLAEDDSAAVVDAAPRRVVFVFPGQGSQWAGMGARLLASCPDFAASMHECAAAFEPYLDFSLLDVLSGADGAPALDRVDVVQPVLFAMSVSLARVWRGFGVVPSAVIGHSQGEIAAACVAGALDLPDAARIVAVRSRIIAAELAGHGAMAAVPLPVQDVRLDEDRITVAVVNGPSSVVLSGDPGAVDELVARYQANGVRARRIEVDYASHSPQVAAVRDLVVAGLSPIAPRSADVPFWSTVAGRWLDTADLGSEYWYRNLREPVRFGEGVRALADQGFDGFIEISPHPVLTVAIRETVGSGALVVGTVRRDDAGMDGLLASVGESWTHGVEVDWRCLSDGGRRADLPTYSFARQRFWLAPASSRVPGGHPWVDAATELADGMLVSCRLSLADDPWLADHAVAGTVVLPGAAVVDLCLAAAEQAGLAAIEELTQTAALVLSAEHDLLVQIVLGAQEHDRRSVTVHSRPDTPGAPWTQHGSGVLGPQPAVARDRDTVWPPVGADEVPLDDRYTALAEFGHHYGPAFRGVRAVWRTETELFAEVALPDVPGVDAAGFVLHPALLDAALQPMLGRSATEGLRLPFAWRGVSVSAIGPRGLRVRLRTSGVDDVGVRLTDLDGNPVAEIQALTPRAVTGAELAVGDLSLARIDWSARPASAVAEPGDRVVLGPGTWQGARALPDLAALIEATETGSAVPAVVFLPCPAPVPGAVPDTVRSVLGRVHTVLRDWLAEDRLSAARLVVVTRGAVAVADHEDVDLVTAPVWGLVRAAQAEHPGRIVLLDVDGDTLPPGVPEPELALRAGVLYAPRLVRTVDDLDDLVVPDTGWCLGVRGGGSVEELRALPSAAGDAPLAAGQVRVAVRAAGLNFHDVLQTLDLVDGDEHLGNEAAGVVLAVGPGVDQVRPGDRVLGVFPGAFGPVAVTDARAVVRMPADWSFAAAASVPVAFVSAYYCLVDLAGLAAGESVLVHAAAGGVGGAAVQLARVIGAQVLATASPAKWPAVRAAGVDRLASSRSVDFREEFLTATGGRGVDVVLNSLAGEFVDASLALVAEGGRFVELGKTDLRDATGLGGIRYQPFDLRDVDPARIGEILAEVVSWFERGLLRLPELTAWDVRRAREAFRFMAGGGHIGKIVLTMPTTVDAAGTVLIAGGGTLGGELARHLATSHGVRRILLTSRRGTAAPGTAELVGDLAELGVTVTVAACDVADRAAMAALLAEHPVTGVVHVAGALDDGLVESLTPQRFDRTLRPKLDGALNLHDLAPQVDFFVLFSSVAGVLGNAGQGNYAAANVFLDSLARRRRASGLPAVSIAWGLWERRSDLTGSLGRAGLARFEHGGMLPMSTASALALFDLAVTGSRPVVVAARLSGAAGRAPARRRVVESNSGPAAPRDQESLLALVRHHAATVLGHTDPARVPADRAFTEIGFDSLTSVELRNRLNTVLGLRLPATVVFDHPDPTALARHIGHELGGDRADAGAPVAVAGARGDDPVAIIGMACRYPGGVTSPDDLWRLVADGVDTVGPSPTDRGWDTAAFPGSFLDDVQGFDAEFFRVSPREALAMDPQQRLLLECSWEAIERAGVNPLSLKESRTGVFVGAVTQEYGPRLHRAPASVEGYLLTGNTGSVLSGRIAYLLGLQGPALTVDTACSSSLVALHTACQSLRLDECSLALAAGATVMATPGISAEFTRQGALAPDGRCKAFAADADGFGLGEGIGVLLLERLSDARRLGHEVLALVRGSAVNSDGASNGLTAPNGPSQVRVIRQAMANAGLSAVDVDVIEAHGTGTVLGDPIEARSILSAYGDRPVARPLLLGSIKSNLGHTQAAAGMAGVIKMVQAMRHHSAPRTLHVRQPTAQVDWSCGTVELLTEARPWPAVDHPRRAAVSSFGISGTNAHVILEQPPDPTEPVRQPVPHGVLAFVVSGRDEASLRGQADRLRAHLADRPELSLPDMAYSLATSRVEFARRGVVLAADRVELLDGLRALGTGTGAVNVVSADARTGSKVVFVLPGQGSQWQGMAGELLASSEVFAGSMRECAEVIDPLVDWSLLDVVTGAAPLDRVDVVQPALFAVLVSLARVWRAFGVVPDAVLGHSQGEIAAAHIAGALTLAEAASVAVSRSKVIATELAGRGGMVSVALPEAEADALIQRWTGRISVAAVNGPAAVVVSGDPEALAELLAACADRRIMARSIPVDYAAHSQQVELVRNQLLQGLSELEPRAVTVPLFSTVTGGWLDVPLDAAYWYRNLREPVGFYSAVASLRERGFTTFVEVSPHPVLMTAMADTAPDALVVGSLRRDDGGLRRLLLSLAEVYAHGGAVDWTTLVPSGRRVELPTYAFQRQDFWLSPESGPASGDHRWLHTTVELPEGLVMTGRVSPSADPWLADHAIGGTVLFPGSGFVEVCLAAGRACGFGVLAELSLHAPLPLSGPTVVQVSVGAVREGGLRPVTVHSRAEGPDADWTEHATGFLAERTDRAAGASPGRESWPPPGAEPVDVSLRYAELAELGYDYGPAFQGVRSMWRRGTEVFAEIALPDAPGDQGAFTIHPALLDAALQPFITAEPTDTGAIRMPFQLADVTVSGPVTGRLRVRLRQDGQVAVFDEDGALVVSIGSLTVRPLPPHRLAARSGGLLRVDWVALGTVAPLGEPVDFADLGIDAGAPVPDLVHLRCVTGLAGDLATATECAVREVLAALRSWLADDRLRSARLVVCTDGAVAVSERAEVDPVAAAVWAAVRSAQAEHPDEFVLVDLDGDGTPVAIPAGVTELAVRNGIAYTPQLVPAGALVVPPAEGWRLEPTGGGTADSVAARPCRAATVELEPGQVRIEVRAAALNFRDVLVVLGVVDQRGIGSEGAGVVAEVGPDVTGFAPGDRVMGMFPGAFGPFAVADARTLVPMPAEWSFVDAASVPIAFATAYYALVDLAGVADGTSVLVHAATGGVGGAAVQLATAFGARVFATTSDAKRHALRAQGIDHIASSRSVEFRDGFLAQTGGRGVDVVLNSLTGELVDASLALLPRGGRFIELGKTDIRDADQVADAHPGVHYQAADLGDVEPRRIGEILAELVALFEAGRLRLPPVSVWDVRRAPDALRAMAAAAHVGRIVLTMPARIDPAGTVLITGGTGTLGCLVARHLVVAHGLRRLVLASRRGPDAPRAAALVAELERLGAEVTVAACDVADHDALAKLVAGHAFTGVVHAAGVLDDGTVASLSPEQIDRVLAPKLLGALNLHELLPELDFFVLFSSMAGVVGSPGQANYAAANAFLDALAAYRRRGGAPAVSVAWGLWAERSTLTGALGDRDVERLRQRVGRLSTSDALALFDAAVGAAEPAVVATGTAPAPVRRAPRRPPEEEQWVRRLPGLPAAEQHQVLLELVLSRAAMVLGYEDAHRLPADRSFTDSGFDSLTSVELRNRLASATGLTLPATITFDHPNPRALAQHLVRCLAPPEPPGPADSVLAELDRLAAGLATVAADEPTRGAVIARLRSMLTSCQAGQDTDLASATDDELYEFVDNHF